MDRAAGFAGRSAAAERQEDPAIALREGGEITLGVQAPHLFPREYTAVANCARRSPPSLAASPLAVALVVGLL